jgi:hypothetical protein
MRTFLAGIWLVKVRKRVEGQVQLAHARRRVEMDEATARAMIKDHFDTGTDDFVRSSEIYAAVYVGLVDSSWARCWRLSP